MSKSTQLTMRPYQSEDDYWRIRNFLREVFVLNDRLEKSWHVGLLDYWRWHYIENCQFCDPVDQVTFLWETADEQIAAVLHPVSSGDIVLQVHPALRTAELEQDMVALAEEQLAVRSSDGQRKLFVQADRDDDLRLNMLKRRGYTRCGRPAHRWWRDLDAPIPDTPIVEGYVIRSMGDVDEFPSRSWASWRAFHPDEPDEDYEGWEWYLNVQSAPLYRRDLDIISATSAGEIASFCTIWYDDVTRSACFVLVGVIPEHQRRGLGKAMIIKGLRRLKRMGATRAFVTGYDPPANALYGSVMDAKDLSDQWVKELSST